MSQRRELRNDSQKSLNMVKTRCKYPKRGQFFLNICAIQCKKQRISRTISKLALREACHKWSLL